MAALILALAVVEEHALIHAKTHVAEAVKDVVLPIAHQDVAVLVRDAVVAVVVV